jgi:hypothetical protein
MSQTASNRDFSLLWRGIYGFPFQLDNLKAYMIVTFCAILLAGVACGFALTTDAIKSSIPEGKEFFGPSPVIFSAGWRVYGSLAFLGLLACLAPSAFFTIIIEDTAAGNEDIEWPDNVWYEYLSKVAFMGWIFGCCAAVSTIFWLLVELVLPMPGLIWWAVTLASAFMILPIPLYSAMIANNPWVLIHPMLLVRFFQKPLAALALYVHSAMLVLPCLALGLWMVLSLSWFLAPVVGLIWATCFLWYARALGRVGYVLSEERSQVMRKKKRKKVRVRREAAE